MGYKYFNRDALFIFFRFISGCRQWFFNKTIDAEKYNECNNKKIKLVINSSLIDKTYYNKGRYLVHSERFFFFSDISMSSIMNRIYLCLLGIMVLFFDYSAYEYINTGLNILNINTYTIYISCGTYDLFEYVSYIFIIYIMLTHSFEYLSKYIFMFSSIFLKINITENIGVTLYRYLIYIKDSYRSNTYTFRNFFFYKNIYLVYILLIFFLYYFIFLLMHSYINTDINILSIFYIESLSFGMCRGGFSKYNFWDGLNSISYFSEIYGFSYFSNFDYSNYVNISYLYLLFKTHYDYIYMLVFIFFYFCFNFHINNFYKSYIKYFIINYIIYVYMFIYTLYKSLFIKYLIYFVGFILLYFICYYLSLSAVHYIDVFSNMLSVFNINILECLFSNAYLNKLFDMYRLLNIYYFSLWGYIIDNSKMFWACTSCLFYKNFSELYNSVLVELTSGIYVHKCTSFSMYSSTYFSIFNSICSSINIYSSSISYGLNPLLFSKVMVAHSYSTDYDISICLSKPFYYINPHKSYIHCQIFKLLRLGVLGWNDGFSYYNGFMDNVIMRLYNSSASMNFKHYDYNSLKLNQNITHNGYYLFDYNNIYNNRMSLSHHSIM